MTNTPPKTAVEELTQWWEEQKKRGLIEMSFCPGGDREISHEDAAKVALAMLRYDPSSDVSGHEEK